MKGDLRGAGERIDRGVARYGEGDLVGAAVEFEEALKVAPEHTRARGYLAWVRDVLAGTRGRKNGLDEDALRAVTEALDDDAPTPVDVESPWDPVPLTPTGEGGRAPAGLDAGWALPGNTPTPVVPTPSLGRPASSPSVPKPASSPSVPKPASSPSVPKPGTAGKPASSPSVPRQGSSPSLTRPASSPSVPKPASSPSVPRQGSSPSLPRTRSSPLVPAQGAAGSLPPSTPTSPSTPAGGGRDSSSTILGMAPPREGVLTPVPRGRPADERPESVTREWGRGTPTGHNLPPLDVPELTEDQIAELISLESSLPPTSSSSRTDLARASEPATERRPAFVEFEAEPTPPPNRAPTLPPNRTPTLPAAPRRDDTNPTGDLRLGPLPFANDFEPLELTPTNARLTRPRAPSEDRLPELNPLPLDERIDTGEDDSSDGGTNPTNPFIHSKLQAYAYGQPPRVDELPPAPGERAAAEATQRFAAAKRALAEGELGRALDVVEDIVTAVGGVDAEPCLPYLTLLEQVYVGAIGPLERVPRHGASAAELDPRAAFLLSRLDGTLTLDDLLDVSGMPRLEALRVLALLIKHRAIVVT